MLYQRLAATAAILLLLGGCSFFGFWDAPEAPADAANIDSQSPGQGPGGPLEGRQLAALPGYLSDQDVAPGRIEAFRGFIGSPARRPAPRSAWAPAAVPIQPVEHQLTLKDLLSRRQNLGRQNLGRQILDLQPISAGIESGTHSLAELIADRDWRLRTSETLNRLFQ